MSRVRCLGTLFSILLVWGCGGPQAERDLEASKAGSLSAPGSPQGSGPMVCFDSGHGNFHTADDAYLPFAELLRDDGYGTAILRDVFSESSLGGCAILVIATPVHSFNKEDWSLPHPSAFTTAEIRALFNWTHRGGGLMLVADHSPIPGAVDDLATVFGLSFFDGEARNDPAEPLPDLFTRGEGTLHAHPITLGQDGAAAVNRVATWTGAAFLGSREFKPLMTYGPRSRTWAELPATLPDLPRSEYPVFEIEGWLAAAARQVGEGRLVVLGETAMCTAQETDGRRRGINTEAGAENGRFCLNSIRWLSQGFENAG